MASKTKTLSNLKKPIRPKLINTPAETRISSISTSSMIRPIYFYLKLGNNSFRLLNFPSIIAGGKPFHLNNPEHHVRRNELQLAHWDGILLILALSCLKLILKRIHNEGDWNWNVVITVPSSANTGMFGIIGCLLLLLLMWNTLHGIQDIFTMKTLKFIHTYWLWKLWWLIKVIR